MTFSHRGVNICPICEASLRHHTLYGKFGRRVYLYHVCPCWRKKRITKKKTHETFLLGLNCDVFLILCTLALRLSNLAYEVVLLLILVSGYWGNFNPCYECLDFCQAKNPKKAYDPKFTQINQDGIPVCHWLFPQLHVLSVVQYLFILSRIQVHVPL